MVGRISKALAWRYDDLKLNHKILTFPSLIKYYTALLLGRKTVSLSVKSLKRNVIIRVGNRIDRNVLHYVFFQKFHLPPVEAKIPENAIIADLGANIGCTVLDMKIRYPSAIIYGYEMDARNYELAKQNTHGLKNVHLFNKAVWTEKGTVSYNIQDHTDAFSISNNSNLGGEVKVPSLSIGDIISENQLEKIDYLKMDIEGAELAIFNKPDIDWLYKINSMNIEFHNISIDQLDDYIKLLEGKGFKVYKSPNHWLSLLAVRTV